MNMYGDYATDDERAVLQECIDGAGSLLTMEEVDARSAELDELRTTLEDAKREALEAAAAEAEAAEAVQASYYNAGSGSSYASAAYYANGSGLTRSAGVNNYNGRRETITAATCSTITARVSGRRIPRASGAMPTATTLWRRAISPRAPRLPVPRASARSMIRVAQPELPITTPVGNLPTSITHDGRGAFTELSGNVKASVFICIWVNRALTVALRWAYGRGAHWFLRIKVFLLEEVVL